MPKQKLTKTFVQKVAVPKNKEKILYSDVNYKGLILEVRNNGTKTFYYRYYDSNKTSYKKIASYPKYSFDDVVTLYLDMNKKEELKELPKVKTVTLNEFFFNYYYPFVKTSKKSFKEDFSFFKNHILPNFGDLYLNEISKIKITSLHLKLKDNNKLSNSVANKLVKFLSYAYNLAILWEIPNVTVNPAKNIKLFKDNEAKERYLTNDEINRLLMVASKCSNKQIKPFLEFLLLSGARKSEVLNAKWEDVDMINNVFTISQTKAGKIRRVPISNKLKEVLNSLPKYNDTYIFTSMITNKPMRDIDYYWYKIRKEANLNDVRIHDLRHTFASILVNKGISLYEVQKLLGHSSITMTQRYAHLSNESLRNAVDVVGRALE